MKDRRQVLLREQVLVHLLVLNMVMTYSYPGDSNTNRNSWPPMTALTGRGSMQGSRGCPLACKADRGEAVNDVKDLQIASATTPGR